MKFLQIKSSRANNIPVDNTDNSKLYCHYAITPFGHRSFLRPPKRSEGGSEGGVMPLRRYALTYDCPAEAWMKQVQSSRLIA